MIEGDVYLKNNVEGMNNDELILFIYQEMLKILNRELQIISFWYIMFRLWQIMVLAKLRFTVG